MGLFARLVITVACGFGVEIPSFELVGPSDQLTSEPVLLEPLLEPKLQNNHFIRTKTPYFFFMCLLTLAVVNFERMEFSF